MEPKRVLAVIDRLAYANLSDDDTLNTARALRRLMGEQTPSEILIRPGRHRAYDKWKREVASLQAKLTEAENEKIAAERARQKEINGLLSQIEKLKASKEAKGTKEPKSSYTYEEIMQVIVSKFGKHHGIPAALCERNTLLRSDDATIGVITAAHLQTWRRLDRYPPYVVDQIEALSPDDLLTRRSNWSEDERKFLIEQYNADPTTSNAQLASSCTERFGRLITECAIKGELNRLRHRGLIERYRPRKATR